MLEKLGFRAGGCLAQQILGVAKVKFVHWPARMMVLLLGLAWVSPASAVYIIDGFGPPEQSIDIRPAAQGVKVSPPGTPFSPGNLDAPGGTASIWTGLPGFEVNNSGSYGNGLGGEIFSYANGDTRTGQIVSTDTTNLSPFAQRDVQLIVTGSGSGTASFFTGGFFLSSEQGPAAELLLQYDGIDPDVAAAGNFINQQGLGGVNLIADPNDNGIYFTNVWADHPVLVQITVWTTLNDLVTNTVGQTASMTIPVTSELTPTTYGILFSSFNTGTGAVNFDNVTGIDIRFTMMNAGDFNIGSPGAPGILVSTPEPASMVVWSLLSFGGLGLGYFRRRKVAK